MSQRNFGFEAKQDERDQIQFWTGFIAGGVLTSIVFCLGIMFLVWKFPA